MYKLILQSNDGNAILYFNDYREAYVSFLSFENSQLYNIVKLELNS